MADAMLGGLSDASLVARALSGDEAAFTVLVGRYDAECTRFAYRLLRHRHDAEDALQETWLRVYRAMAHYEERDSFRAWLYHILVNQCRTAAQRRGRDDERTARDDAILDSLPAPANSQEPVAMNAAVDEELLGQWIGRLEPRLREALLLKHAAGLEYSEMATITGASISALKMRVKRACTFLRPHLRAVTDG